MSKRWRIGDMRRVAAWLGPSRPVVIVSDDPEVSKLGLEVEDMGEAGRETFQIKVRQKNVSKQTGVAGICCLVVMRDEVPANLAAVLGRTFPDVFDAVMGRKANETP